MKLQLQPRDIAILTELGEYGLLDTASIQSRHWPQAQTPRACQQRLKLLGEEGLLKKANLVVVVQEPFKGEQARFGGSVPTAFGLTAKGADVLEQLGGERPRRVSRSDPAASTLLHRLEVIHTRLAIDEACRLSGLSVPEWIYEQDTRPGAKLSDPIEKRHILYERFHVGEHDPFCRPDASCLLQIPKASQPNETAPLIVYWEIDRGTNSPKVEDDKTHGYQALFEFRRYLDHWPTMRQADPAVRVFYVCPTQERVDSIVSQLGDRPVAKWYRFTPRRDATTEAILSEPVWQDIHGKRYAIYKKR